MNHMIYLIAIAAVSLFLERYNGYKYKGNYKSFQENNVDSRSCFINRFNNSSYNPSFYKIILINNIFFQ
jgi:hypothetical protein